VLITMRRVGPTYHRDAVGSEPTCFSPHLYRARNLVELLFNRIKQYRRIAARYDKLAANYLASSS
jgi:transposase